MSMPNDHPWILELTVLSAEGLNMKSATTSFFSPHLKPFITLSTDPPQPHMPTNGDRRCQVYKTVVDEVGGNNPTWGDKFSLPVHSNASIYLQIFSKIFVVGKTSLGWCQIPVTDILEGCRPAGVVHYLSYRVRCKDGSRGHGVVNVAVRLVGVEFGSVSIGSDKCSSENLTYFPAMDVCQIAVGIPVTLFPNLHQK